jgi:ABC-type cobalamin/Fe3+-siderophores transport system ATPase subunit
MSAPLLDVKNLIFSYTQNHPILRDVSFSLSAGQILAILGPNGSGKSTLIKLLIGHLRSAHSVFWQGRSLANWPRRKLARHIAYLPQFPTYDANHRVLDHLKLGRAPYLGILGLESKHDIDVVERTAKLLDLNDLLYRPIETLSGGQRQRVFLARCLIQEPRALLLDEPGTFLDLHHQVDLLKLLKRLAKEQELTVILASHDLNLSAAFADQLILLDKGSIAASGPPSRVLWPEKLIPIYNLPLTRLDTPTGPIIVPKLDPPAR